MVYFQGFLIFLEYIFNITPMKILHLLIFILFSFSSFTQNQFSSPKGKKMIDEGYQKFLKNNYPLAILIFENAAKQCHTDKDTTEILHAFSMIYGVLNTQSKQRNFLQYEKGLIPYLSNKNSQGISICNCLGGAYQSNSDFERAQFYYELAIKKIKSQKKIDDELLYHNGVNNNLLAGLQVLQGDYEKGLLSYQESLNSFIKIKEKLPSDWLEVSKGYSFISDLYLKQKQYLQANQFLRKGHQFIQKEDFDSQISYHNMMGILFKPSALNRPDSALYHIQEALRLQRKFNLENKMGRTFEILGQLQYENKEFSVAQNSFEKSLNYRLPQFTFQNIASSEKNIGMALFQQKKYLFALNHFQKALQYISTDFKSNNFTDNPSVSELKYKNDAMEILKEKMASLLAIYWVEKKTIYLKSAFLTANTANQLIDYQRNSFQLTGSKLFLSQQAHDIFGLAIEATYLLFESTKDERFLAEAFRFSESNKAVVLYESVKASQVFNFQGVPNQMLKSEHKLIKDMAVFENQIYQDVRNETQWRRKLLETTDKLKLLKDDFEKNYPAYFKYKYDTEPITIQEIQLRLKPDNQGLIEYFIQNNTLFTFLITAKNVHFFRQNLSKNFKENIIDFKTKITEKSIDEHYKNLSLEIYKTLFPDNINRTLKAEKIEKIKIIADGELNCIPFESLLVKQPKSLKEINIYLLEKYIIGYLPSATMNWKNTISKTDKSISLKYLGFAPNYEKSFDLPQNQANVTFLSNLFGGKSFVKEKGTKFIFDEQSQNRTKVLHLSMHAGASSTDPMESYLAFTKDSLFVHDIYARNIPTELAILDACETGVGVLNGGEGVMNLSRAFMHAGSQAVAMSLWKLTSSPETSEIIRDFVSLVENGKPKDEALRTAKLNYLSKYRQDLVLSHPFYWSPLILVGNADAIVEKSWFWWISSCVGIIFLIGFWVLKNNKLQSLFTLN